MGRQILAESCRSAFGREGGRADASVGRVPYVLDIYALGVILTHAYVGFGVALRFAPVRETHGAGKSTAWKIARHLVFRPNPEAIASGAAIGRFFNEGSGTLGLDELDLTAEAKERKRIQQVWNLGHEEGASLAFVIGGKRVLVDIFGMIFAAGIGQGFLIPSQANLHARDDALQQGEQAGTGLASFTEH